MARVVIDRVSKSFPGPKSERVPALREVDLVVEDQELLALVGPSGCGKSTLLRLIAGLEELSDGTISIDGTVVNDLPPKDRDLAMVFQSYALYPHMTVFENMAFGLKLRRFPKVEIEQRVRATAESLGLTPFLARLPKALSGGQRQRVAVGRAIVRRPKLFLFDEPLSNLDAQMRVQMRTEIARLHRQLGATMIYVTHDQVEAMTLGDRVAVLKDGVVQQVANARTIYEQPANLFVASFIGSPAMNFFPGTLERGDGTLHFQETDGPAASFPMEEGGLHLRVASARPLFGREGRPVVLGVRPEHFRLADDSVAGSEETRMTGRLDLAELVGAESYWHLERGGRSFVVRVPAHCEARIGQKVVVRVETAKASLFDVETGMAL